MSRNQTSGPGSGGRRRRVVVRAWVAAVLAAALLVAGTEAPASAEPPITLFATPGDEEVITVATPVIAGEVRMANGILLEDLLVEVISKWDHPGASTVIPARAMPAQTFSFTPNLAYNGPYQAIVTATGKDVTLDINTDTAVVSRSFSLAVPPEAPSDVAVLVDPQTRAVNVSWKANAEPDVIGYQLRRSRVADQRGSVIATTSETSYVDTATNSAGGEYTYRVYAVRVGASAESGIMSVPSAPVTATVPDALGRSSAIGSPSAGPAVTSPPTTTVPTRPSEVDLSSFRAMVAEEDDINTEYGTGIPGSDKPVLPNVVESSSDEAGEQAIEQPDGDPVFGTVRSAPSPADSRRSWAFIAAGLLAAVLAAGGLWLRRVVDRSPPPVA